MEEESKKESKITEASASATAAAPAPANNGNSAEPVKLDRVAEIRKGIDEEKKKIPPLIDSIKRARHRLAYKTAEKAAMAKLAAMTKDTTHEIGYLRKRKEALEFRIATEAFSLQAEKDLIRKKNEIEEQLNKALKSFRLKRKVEYINKDIEDLTKEIADIEGKIAEVDKKLDELYSNLRKITGQQRRPPRPPSERGKGQEPKQQEFSLADIAIIKDNTGSKRGSGSDGD